MTGSIKVTILWAALVALGACAGEAGGQDGDEDQDGTGAGEELTVREMSTPVDDLLQNWCGAVYACLDDAGLGTATLEDAVEVCLGDQRSVYWQLVDLGCEDNFVALLQCQMLYTECKLMGSMDVCESEWSAHSECWR